MIVQLKEAITDKTEDYAYVCEPGKPYFVYAILGNEGSDNQTYMINVWGENSNNTIYDIPSRYFKIIDSSIPKNWEEDRYEAYGEIVRIYSFPEMAHNKFFYDDLMNNQAKAVDIFRRYQEIYEEAAKEAAS